ncbi:hypothetical protein [Paenibacillus sp. 22594]|uniref:hypothetical protein n=1 Tax=Paenibacillus sp. 22594 TaxID=3453947 RepID=UPI003F87778E
MNETEERTNLKVLGNSTSAGGDFLDVKVTGECTFNGDVDCRKFTLMGETEVNGSLVMESMKLTGECAVKGSIEGESMRGQGDIKAASIHVEGIKFTGNLSVSGDCDAEDMHISGAFQVDGLLSAETLEISLFGPSRAAEVGGGSIKIKRSLGGKLIRPGHPGSLRFTAGLIEGDHVELQGTTAGTVRGGSVIIGTGCEIETVEYRDFLDIHRNATVRNQVKL